MRLRHALTTLAVIGTSTLTVLASAPAQAAPRHPGPPVRTIATGMNGPFGLDVQSSKRAIVAESGAGQVTSVNLRTGAKRALITGLPGVAGVATYGNKIYAVLGGEQGTPAFPAASVLVANKDGSGARVLADLMRYELKRNPDRQPQFNEQGEPYDALSNPFSMIATKWGLLIADGGANDVLRVHPRTGRISTFFVPPNPTTPACLEPGAQANPGVRGCDSVPTGVAVRGRYVYVSTLGAESPGAAAVYKLDGRTGKVLKVYRGFTSLTGIAVSPSGTIYLSEVLFGAPATEEPPPGFDPSSVGRITRIQHGRISHAPVTMPTGLDYFHGKLYASSWSIAGFLGIPDAGQLVEVNQKAFR
jgi:hypothetical protein